MSAYSLPAFRSHLPLRARITHTQALLELARRHIAQYKKRQKRDSRGRYTALRTPMLCHTTRSVLTRVRRGAAQELVAIGRLGRRVMRRCARGNCPARGAFFLLSLLQAAAACTTAAVFDADDEACRCHGIRLFFGRGGDFPSRPKRARAVLGNWFLRARAGDSFFIRGFVKKSKGCAKTLRELRKLREFVGKIGEKVW